MIDDELYILNYKFIREVTKGVEDDWKVSYLNHARLGDEMEKQLKVMQEQLKSLNKKK